MSSKCGLKIIFVSIIFKIIVNGYAKDISGVERGHNRLNEYISHYETLNYDPEHIRASHNRAKRSVTKDHFVHLKFSAHGRDFHLRLKRDLNTFSDKLEIYDNNGPIDVATDHIYVGKVIGDRNSDVFGSILNDGVFEGKIITERDVYYVEHAKRYFPTQTNRTQSLLPLAMPMSLRSTADKFAATATSTSRTSTTTTATTSTSSTTTTSSATTSESSLSTSPTTTSNKNNSQNSKIVNDNDNENDDASSNIDIGFHSIIYKDSHTDDAYKDMREGHVGGCGITEEVSQWMENIQNSAVEELPEPMSKDDNQNMYKKRRTSLIPNASKLTMQQKQQKDNVSVDKILTAAVAVNADGNDEDNAAFQAKNSDNSRNNSNNSSNGSDGSSYNSKSNNKNLKPPAFKSTASSSTTQQQQHQQQLHPPKKYSSGSNGNGNGNDNGNNNGGANDDFKYPYQKYSKEANFRFDDNVDDGDSGGDGNGGFGYGSASSRSSDYAGSFYDSETGRKYAPNMDDIDDWHERVHERVRRASGSPNASGRREDNKNTCSLYIQTDPLIWRHIREGIADHDRGRKYEIDVKTREEITSLIAHHVTAVNYIYRNTKFDGRTEHRNIRFEVQRIKIDDDSACRTAYNGPHNAFCNEHMDVSNFLNLHSLEDHSDFCLAYVFTYRDFTGGTLGLAWVASASGASGGICEKYKTYTETVGGQYQSTKRSLNTGIITFVNYNSRVPPKVSQLTLAHEIGHNFGSPHDYPQECRPGGLNGNYIMFASATSGDRPNNSKFSPCSIRNISNVLDVLVGNLKRDCFKASEGAFCGNKIVESGEECDCGFNEEECKDNCCYPRLISEYDLSMNSSAKGCTRRAKTQCSPSQGPCCLANSCTFVPTNYHQKCKEETECSWSSICNGTTAECPEPKPRDDKTKCNNGTALCIRGECSGSICLLWNMSECFLTSQAVPHVDKRKLCELACQNGNDTNTCRSTSEFAHLFDLPVGGISLRPGSPCDNFQGYCDVFLKCRAVDADGPLVRLKNLLLNRETLLTVAQWVTENWYIVVLMGIGFIIVMGIFIKCCAVHTPSSNPKKRRARRISETLRAPMNTLRRMRHHQGRGAGPRSIPPPVHDPRSAQHPPQHHRGQHAPPHQWDRHQGGHSVVPLPTGGSHASRSTHVGGGGGRGTRPSAGAAASSRPTSGTRTAAAHGGYAEPPPTALLGGVVGGSNGGVGGGGGLASSGGVVVGAVAGSGGVVSRTQMPLPLPPISAAQQQQQAQQQHLQQLPTQAQLPQAYYAPKAVAPQPVNYNRPPSLHNPNLHTELYADAYAALGRGAYEATSRAPNSKV